MAIKSFLITALAVVTVSAQGLYPGDLVARRDLIARQSSAGGADASACLTVIMSIYSSIPTPPPELLSYQSAHPVTDPCTYTFPASLTGAASSYESQAFSWFSAHSSEIYSALSQCPHYSTLAGGTVGSDICSTAAGGGGGGSGATATKTGSAATATGSAANASGTASKNAAGPRETGFVGAVVAAAGFLGVVAAL